MKRIFATSVILALSSAFAGTPVHSSIYMALGAGTLHYFKNIERVQSAIKASGHKEIIDLKELSFSGANVEGTKVTYKHFKVYDYGYETCALMTKFTVDTESAQLSEVSADYECAIEQD